MTELHIKLQQPYAQGHLEFGALATVRRLADAGGKVQKEKWTSEKAIHTEGGSGPVPYVVFDLPGSGYYGVDITRPRGAVVSREFFLNEGEVRSETIVMESSPHEYLGWQQFAGIVRRKPHKQETVGSMSTSPEFSVLAAGASQLQGLYDRAKSVPAVFKAEVPASAEAWTKVAEAARGADRAWACLVPQANWIPQEDEQFPVWFRQMPEPAEGIELIQRLQKRNSPGDALTEQFPRWMSFDADGQIDLASVPWAWWGGRREPDEEIRFLYDRVSPGCVDHASSGQLTISVQDSRWFGLLEFLASGRLNSAAKIMSSVLPAEEPHALYDAVSALLGKVKGPLVAVAGGIVLLASTKSDDTQEWDRWLENLSNWFPGIPDGAILLGCRRLQRARNIDDLNAAYRDLRESIDRGIPFFSATIRLLSVALAQIGNDIPAADEDRRRIGSVASRVDPGQPFTVIRL